MEKKALITMLLLICFFLTGCSSEEAEAVDKLILSIGTVSLEKADTVRLVRESYEALSDRDKSKVENEALLQDAENALALEVADRIDDIGAITLNSKEAIKAAQDALGMLPENARQYMPEEKLIALNEAEDEFSSLLIQTARDMIAELGTVDVYTLEDGFPQKVWEARKFYNELPEKERTGIEDLADELKKVEDELDNLAQERMIRLTQWENNYEKAVEFAESYFDGRVNLQDASMELLETCSASVVKLAERQIQTGKLESAVGHLEKCVESYPDTVLKEANDLYDNLLSDLEENRPESGVISDSDETWNCSLTVVNTGEQDVLLKLWNEYFQESILIYIRAGEEKKLNVNTNEYYARFATGSHWYGDKELFGSQTGYYSAGDHILRPSAEVPATLILKPPVEGDYNPDRIDASAF